MEATEMCLWCEKIIKSPVRRDTRVIMYVTCQDCNSNSSEDIWSLWQDTGGEGGGA